MMARVTNDMELLGAGLKTLFGRVVAELPLGVEGVLDSALPAPAPPTFYSRFGALAPILLWVVLLFLSVLSKRKRRT